MTYTVSSGTLNSSIPYHTASSFRINLETATSTKAADPTKFLHLSILYCVCVVNILLKCSHFHMMIRMGNRLIVANESCTPPVKNFTRICLLVELLGKKLIQLLQSCNDKKIQDLHQIWITTRILSLVPRVPSHTRHLSKCPVRAPGL